MSTLQLVLLSIGVALAVYGALICWLILVGRNSEAKALARFIPDCLVLFRRLLADDRVPRSRKFALILLLGYLAMPIDLIPDFIPVAGQLDDAILVAVVLRFVLRGGGPELLDQLWPGPPEGARLIGRLAYGTRPYKIAPE